MVKIAFFAVLAALAITSFSFADPTKDNTDVLDLDDEGKPMQYIDSPGDQVEDYEEDDWDEMNEDEKLLMKMRRRKNHHKHKSHRKSTGIQHFTIGADKSAKKKKDVQVTWYASQDLQNPACGGSMKPNNGWHIGAVSANWKEVKCGEFKQICNHAAGGRCVKVRIIDLCAGCDKYAVDLSKSAFKILSPTKSLNEGRIHNLSYYDIPLIPNPWDRGLFGPRKMSH